MRLPHGHFRQQKRGNNYDQTIRRWPHLTATESERLQQEATKEVANGIEHNAVPEWVTKHRSMEKRLNYTCIRICYGSSCMRFSS